MNNLFKIDNKKLLLTKILIIGIPAYLVAFLTEKIIYVVPTIAMMLMIANSVETGNSSNRNRIEEDGAVEDDGSSDGLNAGEGGV